MSKIYNSADAIIGGTPLLDLQRLAKRLGLHASIYAKLEYLNPAGSVKDRVAKAMLDAAEAQGKIDSDTVIIEPTSGNTGIGLCAVCAARGYRIIIVMPDSMSVERRKIMKAYGAEVVLTDGSLGMTGSIERAKELARIYPNSYIPSQFSNPENARAHYETTAREIWDDTEGDVDVLVCGVGTGGTITGTGRYLKEKSPDIKVVAVEPESSQVLCGKSAGTHKIQGIGAGFIPEVLDTGIYDEVVSVTDAEAFEYARLLGKTEGVLVGISSGCALCAAVKIAQRPQSRGKKIVVIMADSGDRYMSTDLFSE